MSEGELSSDSVELNDGVAFDMNGSPASSNDVDMVYDRNVENKNMVNGFTSDPYMQITEQPQQRGFRFRYKCEGPSHGGLQGEGSEKGKKSYPAVKIHNYVGRAKVIVSLVTDEQVPRPHAHELIGKNCQNGQCVMEINKPDMTAVFNNLGIQHVTKKKVADILTDRILESIRLNRTLQNNNFDNKNMKPTDQERKNARRQADEQAKTMQLNVVRMCFQAYLVDNDGQYSHMLPSAISKPIYDSKSPGTAALKICRMDKHAGCCEGSDEVFLLCDKVQKDDISVRFFEVDEDGHTRWENYGSFGPSDVHRQYAIVFKTPAYQDIDIMRPVHVQVQLRRLNDGATSDPKPFTYYPRQIDRDEVAKKRKKALPFGGPGGGGGGGFMGGGANMDDFAGGGSGGFGAFGGGQGQVTDLNFGSFTGTFLQGLQAFGGVSKPVDRSGRRMRRRVAEGESSSSSDSDSDSSGSSSSSSSSDEGESSAQDGDVSSDAIDETDGASALQAIRPVMVDHLTSHISDLNIASKPLLPSPTHSKQSTKSQAKKISAETKEDKKAKKEKRRIKIDKSMIERLGENTSCALHHYAATGDLQMMLLLQRHLLEVPNNQGDTALHIAVINHQVETLRNMLVALRTLPNPSAISAHNNRLQTPLHLAVLTKQSEVVLNLMAGGADPAALDKQGNTPTHLAAQSNDKCLRAILKACRRQQWPELTMRNYQGHTPLHLAVLHGKLECVKELVACGANVNQPDGTTGGSSLHMAVEVDNVAIAGHLLLEGNADVNAPSFSGNTALHIAVSKGNVGMAALLVSMGADPTIENYEPCVPQDDTDEEILPGQLTGLTPRDLAANNDKMLKILSGDSYSSVSDLQNLSPGSPATWKDITIKTESGVDIERIDSGLASLSLRSECLRSEVRSVSSPVTSSIDLPTPWRKHSANTDHHQVQRKLFNVNEFLDFSSGSSDLHKLGAETRRQLAHLLDPMSPGGDWIALTEWLDMGILIEAFRDDPHPTLRLLEEFEDGGGKIEKLVECLSQMKREDAVTLLKETAPCNVGNNKICSSKTEEWLTSGDSTYGSLSSSLPSNHRNQPPHQQLIM